MERVRNALRRHPALVRAQKEPHARRRRRAGDATPEVAGSPGRAARPHSRGRHRPGVHRPESPARGQREGARVGGRPDRRLPAGGDALLPGGVELMEEALRLGADAVGGIPHYEHTREMGVRSVKESFRLAEKHDKFIDIHCDETDDPHSRFLEVMAAEAIRTGMGERVTASHTTAFGSYDNAYAFKLMNFLAKSGINFVANPLVNITLQGRYDTYPKRRGITRVKELWQNGLNVSLGYDDIMDPWYPLGTGGMLQPAHMAVHACHMTSRKEVTACFDMVAKNAARTLGLEDYGLAEGKPANLVLVDAPDRWDAIRRLATTTLVIKGGEVIAQARPPEARLDRK